MLNKKSISIIVPIYNISKYLGKCLDSICAQTFSDIEIILVDDGSTDGSSLICDDYVSRDPRIKVIHKKNEGLVRARKSGLMASSGDYIAYVDGDDWIEPDMLEKLYLALTEQNVDIVMCGRYEETGDSSRTVCHGIAPGRYDKDELIENVYPRMIVNDDFFEWGIFPGVWDKLFKRECLEEFQMAVDDRLTMGEDAACTYPAILNANSIYILEDCLYHYRQSQTSMVRNTYDCSLRDKFSVLFETVNEAFEKYSYIYDLREQWIKYILFLMIPRAGVLYEGLDKLDYLFPFSNVTRGSRIIIYGMGIYGQMLNDYLRASDFCEVVACADRNYLELNNLGLNIINPDDIKSYNFDYIVVAVSFAKVRNSIYKYLTDTFAKEKIQTMDLNVVESVSTKKAFGLV